MKKIFALSLLVMLLLAPGCSPKQSDTPDSPPISIPKQRSWTMTGLLKDWFVTPDDLAVHGQEIYVSGYFDSRVAVTDLDGRVLRYHTIEKDREYAAVCVAVTSQGRVLAKSSLGTWELKSDGTTVVLAKGGGRITHLTVGPDDNMYYSIRFQGKSKIFKMDPNGATTEFLTIDSEWISDLDFDANGNLFMADTQYGRILKYAQGQGVQVFSTVFANPSGEGFNLAFDSAGRLYISSASTHLAMVSAKGTVIPMEFINISGDLVFHEGLLYAMDTYTSKLYEINVDNTTILSKRILLDGVVPWYIDHQGESIVGQRRVPSGQNFFNYDSAQPGHIEPNSFLNALQPDQYTFDSSGNMYLLFGRVLKKLNSTGREEYRVSLPGNLQYNTRLCFNPVDDMIYYFDQDSNSVIRANARGTEIYHRFSSTVSGAILSITKQGEIYAATTSLTGANLVDISKSPEERVVWKTFNAYWFHVGSDAKGNVYAALGPSFQNVVCIDPVKSTAISLFGTSPSRYDWGFVDPQGFLVTDSGTVVVSAPGVLLKFVPDD